MNTENHDELDAEGEPIAPTTIDRLLLSPDVQKAIAQVPDLIKANIESKNALLKAQLDGQTGTTRGATKWILLWTAILALIIIIPVSVLTWNGKLSPDATTFLLGTIVGAVFTFLRNFFPRGA